MIYTEICTCACPYKVFKTFNTENGNFTGKRWTGGIVPLVLDGSLQEADRSGKSVFLSNIISLIFTQTNVTRSFSYGRNSLSTKLHNCRIWLEPRLPQISTVNLHKVTINFPNGPTNLQTATLNLQNSTSQVRIEL